MEKKVRLDHLLVERGLFQSREQAKRSIMAGLVYSDGQKLDKAGTFVNRDLPIQVKGKDCPFVSRGGLKLQKAVECFPLDFTDKVVVDVGASTGGFTDCALQNGAKLVFAVDVGYGQLAWSLRSNPKVINMERTNFRNVEKEMFNPQPEIAVIDASFISLKLLLPKVKEVLVPGGIIVALIKPQFEAGREKVGKKGVVRDFEVHKEVIRNIVDFCTSCGIGILDLNFSPITGPEGNVEYLLFAKLDNDSTVDSTKISEIVEKAKENFR